MTTSAEFQTKLRAAQRRDLLIHLQESHGVTLDSGYTLAQAEQFHYRRHKLVNASG